MWNPLGTNVKLDKSDMFMYIFYNLWTWQLNNLFLGLFYYTLCNLTIRVNLNLTPYMHSQLGSIQLLAIVKPSVMLVFLLYTQAQLSNSCHV